MAAALIVSVAAVVVAIQTKDISDRQAVIAERQLQPTITAELSYGFVHGDARSQFVTVSNVGGPASNLSVDVATLLDVRYVRPGGDAGTIVAALTNYYSAQGDTGQPTGVIATADGIGSNAREVNLEVGAAKLQRATGFVLDVGLDQYARVAYTDELGDRHLEYFRVDPVTGGRTLPSSEGARAFAKWQAGSTGQGVEFDSAHLTPRKILAFVKTHR